MKSLDDLNVTNGLKVLVRCDLDVPFDSFGNIADTFRLDKGLSTLQYLGEKGAHILIAGHIGRPKGQYVEALSIEKLRSYFEDKLQGFSFELLENLRFDSREKANDLSFARELSEKADVYVNNCFAVSHRSHASVVGITKFLPSYAGSLLEEEVFVLRDVLKSPKRPLLAVVGGAKIETKASVVFKFLEICDLVLVGGKIANDLKGEHNSKLLLAPDLTADGYDIGPLAIEKFTEALASASSVIWSGPMGFYEEGHLLGTQKVAEAIISSGAFSVVGGGDTVASLKALELLESFSFVSTGGGAMLDFLIEGNLPALEALGYNG